MSEYYYEVGVMPTEDIEDGYSLYIKTNKELDGDELQNLQYLIDQELISSSDAKDSIYIQPCTKEEYEWANDENLER